MAQWLTVDNPAPVPDPLVGANSRRYAPLDSGGKAVETRCATPPWDAKVSTPNRLAAPPWDATVWTDPNWLATPPWTATVRTFGSAAQEIRDISGPATATARVLSGRTR